jgi:hypothetical protein
VVFLYVITNLRDEKWARELSEFLLILELCSLGADLGEFLLKRARSSAKNALEYEDEIRKQLDDVVIQDGKVSRKLTEAEKGKFWDEVYEVADSGDELFRKIEDLFDISGGRLLTKKELELLKDYLWQKYKVRVRLVDVDHSLKNKLLDWNNRSVVGSFRQGPPPELFLRLNNASELTIFHEMVHLKYWYSGKPKVHFAQEEVIVFDEIWKTKSRWSNKELLDSYNYVVRELGTNKLDKDLIKFTDKYRAEIFQIKTNINLGIK